MAKLSRKKGTTSQILHVFIQDSSSTTGAGLTGLAYNTASLACRYINAGGTLSGAITLQDITTLGTYEAPTASTNMRFKEVNSASPSQGVYELHLHNDWMNLTGGSIVIMLAGATNMAQTRLEIDLQADVNITQWLGTACATPTVAGVPEVDLTHVGGATTNVSALATNVDAVKTKTDYLPSATAGAAGGVFIAGSNAATSITTALTANITGNITGNLSGSVGSLTGHTVQTGDTYALANGANGFVALKSDTAAILVDTGTTLDTKLNNIQGATFDTATDSLEALRNRGDAAWITAAGFSTHSAADVWAVATRLLTAGTNIVLAKGTGLTGLNDIDGTGVTLAADQAVNVTKINGSADAAAQLGRSAATMFNGAAIAGTLSTTEMTTDLSLSIDDQLNGRVLIFARDTTTAALRGQATNITDTTSVGKLTFTALTTAPAIGDTFEIV